MRLLTIITHITQNWIILLDDLLLKNELFNLEQDKYLRLGLKNFFFKNLYLVTVFNLYFFRHKFLGARFFFQTT